MSSTLSHCFSGLNCSIFVLTSHRLPMQLRFDLLGAPPLAAAARTRARVHLVPPPAAMLTPIALLEPAVAPEAQPAKVALKQQITRLERGERAVDWGVASFGDARIDARLPGGGLPLGRLHEIA